MSSKNNRSNDKDSDRSKQMQGKLDPKKPFGKITTYEPESSDDASENESIQPATTKSRSHSSTPISSVGSTARNQFLSCIKNRTCLNGVDFIGLMAKKQGPSGTKNLKGNALKRALSWKEQMLVISKMCHTGANFVAMKEFLESVGMILTANPIYNELTADICAEICDILANVCFMENVDPGILTDYFNKRFADLRNRRNYEAK
jgi:hypothetical protein